MVIVVKVSLFLVGQVFPPNITIKFSKINTSPYNNNNKVIFKKTKPYIIKYIILLMNYISSNILKLRWIKLKKK